MNWEDLYGGWTKAGYVVDVCLMFEQVPADKWKDVPRDAFAYGLTFARFFGPSGTQGWVESIEIGNEPGLFDDATYRAVFENMARGIRQGDPKLRIVTCAVTTEKSHRYAKSLACFEGLENLFDVVNLHVYAEVEGYPTWRRSFPEDPKIKHLKTVQKTIDWRNANAPDKELWIAEFGWDACTKPAPATGDFAQWVGSTETQQAQYLVRSFLVFSFNGDDAPHVHDSSGLTRDYSPKPSFHAVAHLYRTLGDCRFHRVVVQQPGDLYVYEFHHGTNEKERTWAVWSPTGSGRKAEMMIDAPAGTIYRAERTPLAEGAAESVQYQTEKGKLRLTVDESPVFLWWRTP